MENTDEIGNVNTIFTAADWSQVHEGKLISGFFAPVSRSMPNLTTCRLLVNVHRRGSENTCIEERHRQYRQSNSYNNVDPKV